MSEVGRYCCFNCPGPSEDLKRLSDPCPTCGRAFGFPLASPPSSIGEFDVEQPLGRGFYGAAFVGRKRGPIRQRRVLKVSPKAMYAHFGKSFADEVSRHAEVSEGAEHVVALEGMFDADVTFGEDVISCHVAELRYLDGDPLASYIFGHLPLNAAQAAQIACDLFRMREEFEKRLVHHNDLHGANIVVERLAKPRWRGGDTIEPGIRAVAIDLGSVADQRRSGGPYVGDMHWIGRHIRSLAERLLRDGDAAGDLEKRMALKLLGIAQTIVPVTENQRPPSADDLIRLIGDEYYQVAETWRPWRKPLVLKRFEESYNAQTMYPWYVQQLLVDPDGTWLAKVSAPGPLVLTGMRGCGKTMLLQSIQFHARAAIRDGENEHVVLQRLTSDGYVGLFVSAQRLIPVSSSESRPTTDELFARLLVAYAASAARAIAHLADLEPGKVAPGAAAGIAQAVANSLDPKPEIDEPATLEQLERRLTDLLINLSRSDSSYRLATNASTAFPHLAEAVRRCSPIWNDAQVLFLLDDVSTRYLDAPRIEELLSALIFVSPTCAFKLTSEAQTIFLTLKSPGQVHPAAAGRDFQTFDLGAEVYERLKRRDGRAFISDILKARARLYPSHPRVAPAQVLGDVALETIARSIVGTQPKSNQRKKLYRGLSALAGVCVGDIGSVIQIYQQILTRARQTFPVPPQDQNDAFQDFCASHLYHLDRRHGDLKAMAMSFAEASYQLLMQSGRPTPAKRLRQYTSIYVRITSGDVDGQMNRLRELVDAGVFVFTGAAPRTKTHDSNPTQQFQLTYRKIFGLVNFIGLSERDRFELSGENLQEWLTNPANGKEILLRNLAKDDGAEVSTVEDQGGEVDEEVVEGRPFDRAPTLDLVLPETAGASPVEEALVAHPPLTLPRFLKIAPADLPLDVDTLVVGLGFEDRTLEAFRRLLAASKPRRILAVRYDMPGHSQDILKEVGDIPLEEVTYGDVMTAELPTMNGRVIVDVTGLAKPALFHFVRQAVREAGDLTLAYTAAEQYFPEESELASVLEAYSAYNRHDTLAALKDVLTGESPPYKLISLLTTEADGTRQRSLSAFASAKHERILHLIDDREYEGIEIVVDGADTSRAKVAEMAARVALESSPTGQVIAADATDLPAILDILARRHQAWYVAAGLSYELGLTGNKIQATAAAILSAVLPVNEVWYVAPANFDERRFTRGVGSSHYFRVGFER